jgi:hypothetical protein
LPGAVDVVIGAQSSATLQLQQQQQQRFISLHIKLIIKLALNFLIYYKCYNTSAA